MIPYVFPKFNEERVLQAGGSQTDVLFKKRYLTVFQIITLVIITRYVVKGIFGFNPMAILDALLVWGLAAVLCGVSYRSNMTGYRTMPKLLRCSLNKGETVFGEVTFIVCLTATVLVSFFGTYFVFLVAPDPLARGAEALLFVEWLFWLSIFLRIIVCCPYMACSEVIVGAFFKDSEKGFDLFKGCYVMFAFMSYISPLVLFVSVGPSRLVWHAYWYLSVVLMPVAIIAIVILFRLNRKVAMENTEGSVPATEATTTLTGIVTEITTAIKESVSEVRAWWRALFVILGKAASPITALKNAWKAAVEEAREPLGKTNPDTSDSGLPF